MLNTGHQLKACPTFTLYTLTQCFSTFFATRHPWSAISIFGGTPRWQNRFKEQWIAIIGGTPGTISRHPCVPRHPGWEPHSVIVITKVMQLSGSHYTLKWLVRTHSMVEKIRIRNNICYCLKMSNLEKFSCPMSIHTLSSESNFRSSSHKYFVHPLAAF